MGCTGVATLHAHKSAQGWLRVSLAWQLGCLANFVEENIGRRSYGWLKSCSMKSSEFLTHHTAHKFTKGISVARQRWGQCWFQNGVAVIYWGVLLKSSFYWSCFADELSYCSWRASHQSSKQSFTRRTSRRTFFTSDMLGWVGLKSGNMSSTNMATLLFGFWNLLWKACSACSFHSGLLQLSRIYHWNSCPVVIDSWLMNHTWAESSSAKYRHPSFFLSLQQLTSATWSKSSSQCSMSSEGSS